MLITKSNPKLRLENDLSRKMQFSTDFSQNFTEHPSTIALPWQQWMSHGTGLTTAIFTLPHSYQCLMLNSTRLLTRTIMVSSQYNIMLCHYVFLLQPKNHHTFFHTLHGSGFLLFNIWLPPSLFMRLFFLKLIYTFIVYHFKYKLSFTHLLTGPPSPPKMYLVGQIWDWF